MKMLMAINSFAFHAGRAKIISLCFHYGDIKVEDIRFLFQQWPKLKQKFPFAQVPVLEVDGVMIPQSAALCRYAATLSNLYPSDPYEALLVDSVVHTIRSEYYSAGGKLMGAPEAEKENARKTLVKVDLPDILMKHDAYIAKISKGSTFITSKETIADLMIYHMLWVLKSGVYSSMLFKPNEVPDFASMYPTLGKIEAAVAELPKIKALAK